MGGLYVSNYEWMATIVLVFFVFIMFPFFCERGLARFRNS